MTPRDNYLRAARFDRPDAIPMTFSVNQACWHHYPPEALAELMVAHPMLFPDFDPAAPPPEPGPNGRADQPYTDVWGCVWTTTDDGITGTVTGHALADWADFDGYVPPAPGATNGLTPVDWSAVADRFARRKAANQVAVGGLTHGHTWLRLCDLRGYEALLFDMVDEEPRLDELIEIVEAVNLDIVRRTIDAGAEVVIYADDMGMQVGPMLTPDQLRRYIKPSYQRLIAPAQDAGCIIHMHSDGDIRTLAPDLIDGGVEILNLQDLVNGVDWIAANLLGTVCIELDIDRQKITPFGTPADIDRLIRTEVETLSTAAGGLMMIYGLFPGVPLANVKAVMDAMERYATYWN